MIVVTGAGGFIGSCLITYLNNNFNTNIIAVDALDKQHHKNLNGKIIAEYIDRNYFLEWFASNANEINFVFHIGARTDTAEQSETLFNELNVSYSQSIWNICTENQIPLIYASSAATYGNGAFGYSDDHNIIPKLKPLNPYGWSKQKFDLWALNQHNTPPKWYGFKFFNVFGPNEYHKARMASVIFNAYHQIQKTSKVKLFASNDPSIPDGMQRRDFIYVKDLLQVLYYFFERTHPNGIYNLGSGTANSFLDLANSVFNAMNRKAQIEFIPMPADLVGSYQNYTCADMSKLHNAGYHKSFYNFEDAVKEYVNGYLVEQKMY